MKRIGLIFGFAVLSAILIIPSVSAGSIVSVRSVEEVNGSIGVTLYNELGTMIYTDTDRHSSNVLEFYLDNNVTKIDIDKDQSDSRIKSHNEGFVVLDAAWPSQRYRKLIIEFDDASGGEYPPEEAFVFAKPGLTITGKEVSPDIVLVNESFTYTIHVEANGEEAATSINLNVPDIKFYDVSNISAPASMQPGEKKDIVILYEPTTSGGFSSVDYMNTSLRVELTYKYFGKTVTHTFAEEINAYDSREVELKVPQMNMHTEMGQDTIPIGSSTDLDIYIWNSNDYRYAHSACHVNTTLTADNPNIIIEPSATILLGSQQFPSDEVQPDEPNAEYTIVIGNKTPTGAHTLTLVLNYADCPWPLYLSMEETLEITMGGAVYTPPEPDTEVDEPEPEPEPEAQPQPAQPAEPEPEEMKLSTILMAAVAGIAIFGVGGYFFLKFGKKIM
jgi:hypothetical protein